MFGNGSGSVWLRRVIAFALAAAAICGRAGAYSVQTHEQLIDLAWKPAIVPLLLARYPGLTDAQLTEAHAYAYGGCAIQDLGYYPFGHQLFSDLTHYVRSGDFVRALIRDAKTPDELAFAIGALSHYVGDSIGHAEATNLAVAVEFPRLQAKYGDSVSYERNPHAHVQTEFAFDIDEIAKHRFAPSAYLSHVGLKVPRTLLARAFFETYGLPLTSVLGGNKRPTLFGYRFAVRRFLPRIAYAETVLHRGRMPADTPGPALDTLTAALNQSEFENGWNQYRRKAGIGTYTLAGLIVVLPKIGPLKELAIKGPDVATEENYVESLNDATARLRKDLADLRGGDAALLGADFRNLDLDTGDTVRSGRYRLTDETYARLLGRVTAEKVTMIPAGLEANLLLFYRNPDAPNAVRKDPAAWARVQSELVTLQGKTTVPEP